MQNLAALFRQAVMQGLQAYTLQPCTWTEWYHELMATRIQATWRMHRMQKTYVLMHQNRHAGTCTLQYGIISSLGGLCIVNRRIPIRYTAKAFMREVRRALIADGIKRQQIRSSVHQKYVQLNGCDTVEMGVVLIDEDTVARIVPPSGNGIMAMARCSKTWNILLCTGQHLSIHPQPRGTVEETVQAITKQLSSVGLDLLPCARQPTRYNPDEQLHTPVFSAMGFNCGLIMLHNKFKITTSRNELRRHPDLAVDVSNVFDTRRNRRMRLVPDDIVEDMALLPPVAKRVRITCN